MMNLLKLICILLYASTPGLAAERIWWDGSREMADTPLPGQLLTGNPGYWGPQVFTGVEYHYEGRQPDNPADRIRNQPDTFGNRLLDGRARGDWHVPIGVTGDPPTLNVVFDFKRPCVFSELHLSSRSRQLEIGIAVRTSEEENWRTVLRLDREDCPDQMFHRFQLDPEGDGVAGRYLRLTLVGAGYHTYLEEVWVWGDAEVSPAYPEAIEPRAQFPAHPGGQLENAYSVPGIVATAFGHTEFVTWREQMQTVSQAPAVWARIPMPDRELEFDQPIFPELEEINPELPLIMARNERENLLLTLTSTDHDGVATIDLEPVVFMPLDRPPEHDQPAAAITAELLIGGAIPTAHRDGGNIRIRPFFQADNLPDSSILQRYLANADSLLEFPRLTLAPGETAVLMLSVKTEDAAPGLYQARLEYPGGDPAIVTLEVVDVSLPFPFAWIRTWSGVTPQSPFTTTRRQQADVAYKQEMGVTVWNGFPEPGSVSAIAREGGRAIFRVAGLPARFPRRDYHGATRPEDLAEEDRDRLVQHTLAMVEQAAELGLDYDQWFVELWDEPGRGNASLYGVLAQIIKQTDPDVNIYMNPLFWEGGRGFVPDQEAHPLFAPFYNQYIDISVPHQGLDDPVRRPRLYHDFFDQPRWVRAYFIHPVTRGPRGGRGMSWRSFARNWNGWGYFAYYRPGGGSPWDITTWVRWPNYDYQMVFPGPNGPIPTLLSETAREGWEDYQLLSLLRDSGKNQVVEDLLQRYRDGEPMSELRLRALHAAAEE